MSLSSLAYNAAAILRTAIYVHKGGYHYPHDDNFFIFGNVSTHLKRADTAISARKKPLDTSKSGW